MMFAHVIVSLYNVATKPGQQPTTCYNYFLITILTSHHIHNIIRRILLLTLSWQAYKNDDFIFFELVLELLQVDMGIYH